MYDQVNLLNSPLGHSRSLQNRNLTLVKVTVDLQSAFRKMLCLRAALKKTIENYISMES